MTEDDQFQKAGKLFRVRLVLFILHSVVSPRGKFGLLCQGESLASCRDLLSSLVKVTGIYFLFLSRKTNVCCQGILGVHLLQAHGSSLFVLFVCAHSPRPPPPPPLPPSTRHSAHHSLLRPRRAFKWLGFEPSLLDHSSYQMFIHWAMPPFIRNLKEKYNYFNVFGSRQDDVSWFLA